MTSWQKETFLFSRLGFSEDDVDIPFTAMAAGGSGSALLALELPSSSLAELPSLNSDSEFAESNRPVVSGVEGRSEDEASPLALSPTIFSDDRPGLFFRFSFAALMTSLSRLFTFLSFTIVIVFGLKISRADSLHDGKTCCPSLLDDSDGSRFLNSTSCSPPAACSGYFSFEKHIPIFISCIQVCLPPSLFPGKDSRPASRGCRRLDPLGLSPLSPPASELQNPLYVHPQRTQEKNTQKKKQVRTLGGGDEHGSASLRRSRGRPTSPVGTSRALRSVTRMPSSLSACPLEQPVNYAAPLERLLERGWGSPTHAYALAEISSECNKIMDLEEREVCLLFIFGLHLMMQGGGRSTELERGAPAAPSRNKNG